MLQAESYQQGVAGGRGREAKGGERIFRGGCQQAHINGRGERGVFNAHPCCGLDLWFKPKPLGFQDSAHRTR